MVGIFSIYLCLHKALYAIKLTMMTSLRSSACKIKTNSNQDNDYRDIAVCQIH